MKMKERENSAAFVFFFRTDQTKLVVKKNKKSCSDWMADGLVMYFLTEEEKRNKIQLYLIGL